MTLPGRSWSMNKVSNDPLDTDMMMTALWMMIHSAEWWHRLTFGQTLDLMASDQILLEDSLKWQNLTLTLQNHYVRACLITGGRLERLTLTLAPMGMVAPWRCQELHISGKAGNAFIHSAMESITSTKSNWTLDLKTQFQDWTWLK